MLTTREYNSAVKNFSRNIYRYVFKSLSDKDAADDIVQDVFIKLWEHRNNVHPDKVKYWLFRTAHNTMINSIKRSNRMVSIDTVSFMEPCFSEHCGYELREVINKALDLLPQRQKTMLLLRDLEGYNYKEIGEIVDMTEGQVKINIFRARQKMRTILKDIDKVV